MQAHLIYWRYIYPEAAPLFGAPNRTPLWGITPPDRLGSARKRIRRQPPAA